MNRYAAVGTKVRAMKLSLTPLVEKNDRIAASLVFRLRALLPRDVSTKSRNLPTRSASISVTRRSVGWRPRRSVAKVSSSRKVGAMPLRDTG